MKSMIKKIILGIIICILFTLSAILMNGCSLQPQSWQPPTKPEFKGKLSLNQHLQKVQKIDLKGWNGPEDIIRDSLGNIYCGAHKGAQNFKEGQILKISPSGKIETFYKAEAWVAGLHFDQKGNLIALEHKKGLISISPEGNPTVLANKDEKGRLFLFPNGMDIASNGKIYFTITAHESAYDIKFGRKLILEHKPSGGLYQYDPTTKTIQTLIEGLYFGNGVAISQKEDYLLLTETTRYRVLRYWLSGNKKGNTEVLMENLPGFPNGISIREDGSFWLGFTTLRNDALDKIHPNKTMKKFVYGLPGFLQPKQDKFGMVLHISEQGDILQALFDPKGDHVPEAGAVREYEGKLYLGGDIVPYIAILELSE